MRLGDVLIAEGSLSEAQVTAALGHQRTHGGRLGSCLVALHLTDPDTVARGLARLFGVPAALLRHLAGRDPALAEKLPAELAQRYAALPIAISRGSGIPSLVVCMRDPQDAAAVAAITTAVRMPVVAAVACEAILLDHVAKAYASDDEFDIDLDDDRAAPAVAAAPAPAPRAPSGSFDDLDASMLTLVDLDDKDVARDHSQVQMMTPRESQHSISRTAPQVVAPPAPAPVPVAPAPVPVAHAAPAPAPAPRAAAGARPVPFDDGYALADASFYGPPPPRPASLDAPTAAPATPPRTADSPVIAHGGRLTPPAPSIPAPTQATPTSMPVVKPPGARTTGPLPVVVPPTFPRSATPPIGVPAVPPRPLTAPVPVIGVGPRSTLPPITGERAAVDPSAPPRVRTTGASAIVTPIEAIDLATARAAIAAAQTRDAVGDAAIGYLRSAWSAAFVLVVKDGLALGHRGYGGNVTDAAVQALTLPLGLPSIFKTVHDSGRPFVGAVPEAGASTVQGRFFKLFVPPPDVVVVLPVLLRQRPVCLLYVHGRAPTIGPDRALAELGQLADVMAAAYQRQILDAKKA